MSSARALSVPAPARTDGSDAVRAGWTNVVVAAIVMLATLPGRTQGLGLITEPLLSDLHLDRIVYANINLWATLIGAAICLPIGRVLDRFGLKWTTASLALLLAIVVWRMSALTGGIAALFVLVLMTRAIGQSALSVASITAVGKSFDRNVGFAMGVYSVLLSVLFAAAFVAIGAVVTASGWRTAWMRIAVALAIAVAPIVALFLREPVTTPAAGTRAIDDAQTPSANLSLPAALRTPAFWVFAGATSLFGLVSSGLGLFNEAVLAERGFDQRTFHQFLAASALLALVGQFACGWMTTRWPMQRLLGTAMFVYAAALAILPSIATLPQLWTFAALIGVSGGMVTVIFFAIWRRFGPAHLGRIQGAAQMLTVLASAIGPLLFATCAEWTGSYAPILYTLAPFVLVIGAGAFKVKLPGGAG
ncbi:MAG TPA: MFS transporter [Vicinamibacterales bacterium]|jgi:MFS family permease